MEKFIKCAGLPIRVSTQGDNKDNSRAIVLLHGYLEGLEVWEDMAKHLGKYAYTVFMDMPGHGVSGTAEVNSMELVADVVADLCKQFNITTCLLVGHSMGGYATLAFAKKYPEMLSGLCLFHSTPNPDTEEKKANRDREVALLEAGKKEMLVRTSIPNMFAPDNIKRMSERIAEIEAMANISEDEGLIACLKGMKIREDMNEMLSKFEKPHLFILGKYDQYISWEAAQAMIERFPKAKSLVLEKSGHCGFFEEPAITTEQLINFAKDVLELVET